VVPVGHLAQLAAARRAVRPHAVTETLVVSGGRHSWLYEFPAYRAAIACFLAITLGGAVPPDEAAALAEAVPAVRLPEPERLTALDEEPGGFRSLARIFQPRGRFGARGASEAPAARGASETPPAPAAADGPTSLPAAIPEPGAPTR